MTTDLILTEDMLKGRSRDPRVAAPAQAHLAVRSPAQTQSSGRQPTSPTHLTIRTPSLPRAPLAKPEPDYEVVEFPSEQYVNAKLQPPPPPPPRPPTGNFFHHVSTSPTPASLTSHSPRNIIKNKPYNSRL